MDNKFYGSTTNQRELRPRTIEVRNKNNNKVGANLNNFQLGNQGTIYTS